MGERVEVVGVPGIGEVVAGDDLAALIVAADADLRDGDVVCVASKLVSKSEAATVPLEPGEDVDAARRRAALADASAVVVDSPFTLVTRTSHGFVCAQGGIDASNVPDGGVLGLPADPDASARTIRRRLEEATGLRLGVIVTDTFGRPWRMGQTEVALGCAGLEPIRDERGGTDRDGRELVVTEPAVADMVASAADLVRDKAAGLGVVVVRGLPDAVGGPDGPGAAALLRPPAGDLFARGRGRLADTLAGRRLPGDPVLDPAAWTVPVAEGDVGTAVAAAERCGDVTVTVDDAGMVPTQLVVRGGAAAQVGLAAATAVAALLDCGWAATVELTGDAEATVLAGAPQPPPP